MTDTDLNSTPNDPVIITRKEYMNDSTRGAHERYYAQFVTPETKSFVELFFTREELIRSFAKDRNLNEGLPLSRWDAMCFTSSHTTTGPFSASIPFDHEVFKQADSYGVTRGDLVCIAKEAARQIIKESHHV